MKQFKGRLIKSSLSIDEMLNLKGWFLQFQKFVDEERLHEEDIYTKFEEFLHYNEVMSCTIIGKEVYEVEDLQFQQFSASYEVTRDGENYNFDIKTEDYQNFQSELWHGIKYH